MGSRGSPEDDKPKPPVSETIPATTEPESPRQDETAPKGADKEGWKDVAPYVVLLAVLLLKPEGLFGLRMRKKV